MTIELSIVSVVKNEQLHIEQMIESVLHSAPSFIDLELIIIDDHSTDTTREICNRIAQQYSFVKVVTNKGLGKVAGTLNAINLASKTWIKCIDGDDFVDLCSLTQDQFKCDAFYHDYYRYMEYKPLRRVNTSKKLAKCPQRWNYFMRSIPKGMFFFKKTLFDGENIS